MDSKNSVFRRLAARTFQLAAMPAMSALTAFNAVSVLGLLFSHRPSAARLGRPFDVQPAAGPLAAGPLAAGPLAAGARLAPLVVVAQQLAVGQLVARPLAADAQPLWPVVAQQLVVEQLAVGPLVAGGSRPPLLVVVRRLFVERPAAGPRLRLPADVLPPFAVRLVGLLRLLAAVPLHVAVQLVVERLPVGGEPPQRPFVVQPLFVARPLGAVLLVLSALRLDVAALTAAPDYLAVVSASAQVAEPPA
jgi:hypothetical protein